MKICTRTMIYIWTELCLLVLGQEVLVINYVTSFGQSLTLLCKFESVCNRSVGWEVWSPDSSTIFGNVKNISFDPNTKYSSEKRSDGYTLNIRNLSQDDLNKSYTCNCQFIRSEKVFLTENSVFSIDVPSMRTTSTPPNVSDDLDMILTFGIGVPMMIVAIVLFIKCYNRRKSRRRADDRKSSGTTDNSDEHKIVMQPLVNKEQQHTQSVVSEFDKGNEENKQNYNDQYNTNSLDVSKSTDFFGKSVNNDELKVPGKENSKIGILADNQRFSEYLDELINKHVLEKSVLDCLVSTLIVSLQDREEIIWQTTQQDRNKALLDILMSRPYNSFDVFVTALEKSANNSFDEIISRMKTNKSVETLNVPNIEEPNTSCYADIKDRHIRLQKAFIDIVHGRASENIPDTLFSEDILTVDDFDEIQSHSNTDERNKRLLSVILRKDERAYKAYLSAIAENDSNLSKRIEETEIEEKDKALLQIAQRQRQDREAQRQRQDREEKLRIDSKIQIGRENKYKRDRDIYLPEIWICDMKFLSDGSLVIVDGNGNQLVICNNNGEIKCQISLESVSKSVAVVDKDTVAVTMYLKNKLTFVNVKNKDRFSIEVKGCYYVTNSNNKLFVSCEDKTIKVLSREGEIIKTVLVEFSLTCICKIIDGNFYGISSGDAIHCLDPNGKELFTIKNNLISGCRLTMDNEIHTLLVCGISNKVYRVSPDGKQFEVIVGEIKNTLDSPCICYNPELNSIHIGRSEWIFSYKQI